MRALRWYVVLVVVAAGCATNPATGRKQLILMSEAEEVQLGRQSDAEVRQQMGVYEDQALQQYVTQVGQKLARASHRPNLPWTFAVVNEAAVNAFALPGGFVYLTRGILPFLRDEAELAAVMGHEIGHVDGRHSVEAVSKQTLGGGGLAVASILLPGPGGEAAAAVGSIGLGALFLKHSREAELEADQLGVRYTSTNGWDPQGMPGLLNTLARLDEASGTSRGVPNWALTHPPAADRVEKVQAAVAAARSESATARNETTFERHIDGVVFGDSREQGFVRGSEFLHPVLRFALRFPEQWEIVNSSEQVAARPGENANAAMVLQLASGSGGSIEQSARASMENSGYQLVDGERTRINGLDAFVGTYQGVSGNTRIGVRAAHIRSGQQTYIVAGLAVASEFGRNVRLFDQSIQTFRALSAQEAERLQLNRIDLYTVRSGETWTSLASGPGGGRVKASTLAIMNGSDPNTPPRAGARIRIVVAG
jgi:predicted Zn-dependent protease